MLKVLPRKAELNSVASACKPLKLGRQVGVITALQFVVHLSPQLLSAMATTALLRQLPSPALSSSQPSFSIRPSRAMCAFATPQIRLPTQVVSSFNFCTDQIPAVRSQDKIQQVLIFPQQKGGSSRHNLEESSVQRRGLSLAIAVAYPVLTTALLCIPEASAITMGGGETLLSAAEVDPNIARIAITVLGPVFAALNLLFIVRIVMSWYPQLPVSKFPFNIAYAPTEPVLGPTRRLIPPVGGVDVSPVIWVALMSFFNEILLGQQGLLVLLSQQQP